MTRLELRVVVAAVLAATVVLGAVVCAAYGLTIVASAMSILFARRQSRCSRCYR